MRTEINEEVAVRSLIMGDKEVKRQLLVHIPNGDVFFGDRLQTKLVDALVRNSTTSDDVEDVLSAYCHTHYLHFGKPLCPEAMSTLINSLKRDNVRAKVFLCEYMKVHDFDDASLSLLINSLNPNCPLVGEVMKSYIEDEQFIEKYARKGHIITGSNKQRLIDLVLRGNSEARKMYLSYARTRGENRAFCEEEVQCVDLMDRGFSEFKKVLSENYLCLDGKLKLLESLKNGSTDAYDVLSVHGIADFGDETEYRTIELLAAGCKGAKELLIQYAKKYTFCGDNLRKLQRMAAKGSDDATEILQVHKVAA